MAISYPHRHFNPTDAGPNKRSALTPLRLLGQFSIEARVALLPPMVPQQGDTATTFGGRVQVAIADELNIDVAPVSAY